MNPQIGDTIKYRAFGGELRTITVTHVSPDIKNGQPGFHGYAHNGDEWWGYVDQIVTVRSPA